MKRLGRPELPQADRKKNRIQALVTDSEMSRIASLSRRLGVSVSECVRRLILDGLPSK